MYFVVIGRYGIRVGDRIPVAGVIGDVIDIGLVRMCLMELAGTGIDLYSIGRIVVFSNSVLFQATRLYLGNFPVRNTPGMNSRFLSFRTSIIRCCKRHSYCRLLTSNSLPGTQWLRGAAEIDDKLTLMLCDAIKRDEKNCQRASPASQIPRRRKRLNQST